MKKTTFKITIILPAIALCTFTQSASAQSANEKVPAIQPNAIIHAFSIIEQLEPVKLPSNDGSVQKPELFSFDMPKIKQLLPELIRTETVWVQKGKNNQAATNKETVDFAQLVPVLVAALQEQNVEINELKLKLNQVQNQLSPDKEAAR